MNENSCELVIRLMSDTLVIAETNCISTYRACEQTPSAVGTILCHTDPMPLPFNPTYHTLIKHTHCTCFASLRQTSHTVAMHYS